MKKTKSNSTDYSKEIKRISIDVFKEHPYKSYNYKQIIKKFQQEPFFEEAAVFLAALEEEQLRKLTINCIEELAIAGELEETDRGKFRLFPTEHFITGRIDITSSGNAYVINEEFEEDIFIPKTHTVNAMNGDLVKVSLYARKKGSRSEGEVVEVLERAKTEFVGTLQISDRFAFLTSDNPKNKVDIFIPLNKLNGASQGSKAVAKIIEWNPDAKNPSGEIVKVLGFPGENNAEMDAILIEYGFPLSFPVDVEKEAEEIPYKIPKKEIAARRDFRKVPTFTIDPVDAKDFDDALSVQKLPSGNYEVGIHIADVSHYVQPGTALDTEGFNRATSIYLVDRVIPMLPEKLSNNVCSLRPGEDKLCYSAVFEIAEDAEIINEWFGRTVIHSQRRFSYEEAQLVIETGEGDMLEEIQTLQRLALLLRKKRFQNGAITFDKVEVKFKLDEAGMPIGVYLKESKDSNKLIEDFMLLANRKVAEFVGKKLAQEKGKEYPFVYRVHDSPSSEKLANFSLFAGRFGHSINTKSDKDVAHSLNKLMKEIKGTKEQNVLEQLAIRTMAKAIYTTNNIGHYGLAFDYYTHFTSPIRRYPDVMVHRLLDHYLKNGKPVKADEIQAQCKHSTDMEIRASEAERASIKFKQVQYMIGHEGEVFDGLISGVTEWGLYVELVENKCEGLIRVRDLDDDFYDLDEKNYCLIGRRNHRKFQLGDSVKVQLKTADLARKQIDFLLDDPSRLPDSFSKSPSNSNFKHFGESSFKPNHGSKPEKKHKGNSKGGSKGKSKKSRW